MKSKNQCCGIFRLCACLWCLLAIAPLGLNSQSFESLHDSAKKWIELEQEKSRVENDWDWQKEVLQATLSGLEEKKRQLVQKRDELVLQQETDRNELEGLEMRAKALSEELDATFQHVQHSINQLIRLRPSLPPQLASSLDLAFDSLTAQTVSMSEKLQLLVTVVNRCGEFNHAITYSEEIVYASDAQDGHVMKVVYWGLSHAYAFDPQSGATYFGGPSGNVWRWEQRKELQQPLLQLISILNEEADPRFIDIPVRMKRSSEEVAP